MNAAEVSILMDQAVDSLRNTYDVAKKNVSDQWFVWGGKEQLEQKLKDSLYRINYLDTELHQQVLKGERPFSLFAEIANGEADFLRQVAGYAGKWNMTDVMAGVVLDTGQVIATGLEKASDSLNVLKWVAAAVVVWKLAEVVGIFAPKRKSDA